MTDVLIDLARSLMFFLDNVVYGLIPTIYKLFVYLSEIDLFTGNTQITNLINHIYVLLGIFMLFKISFSLLQYIVDPNSFRDSSKGMGKLITNVLVALVLLVSVPSIFSFAMEIQTVLVQSNAVGRLILGDASVTSSNDVAGNMVTVEGVNSMARDLQFMLYGTFYSVDEDAMKLTSDNSSTNGVLSSCNGTSGILGSVDMAYANNGDCLNQLATQLEENDDASANNVTLFSFFKYVDENGQVQDERDFEAFGRLLNWKANGKYVINYLPFISAVVGIYVVFLLISFSVDVAVRAIKLCFLQMVAPIAIVSYIDPKESISNGKLNSWIKECVTTYLSLFLRLATIYLIMFVVSLIASTVISNGTNVGGLLSQDTSYNIWVYLFLVIGAFMFAKQVPNIIEKIFGIKGSGELHLNPFKNAGAAALIGGVAGAGLSSVASGISAFNTSKSNKESTGTALMRGLGGAGGGLLRGVYDGATAKNLADVGRRSMTNAGIAARNASIARGTNMFGRTAARARNAFGMPSRKEIMDQGIDQRETVSKHISNIDKYMEGELAKKSDLWKNIQAQRTRYEQLRAEGKISAQEYTDFNNQAFSDEKALKRMFYEAGGITDANGNLLRDKNGKLVFGVDGYLTQDKASVLEEARDIGIDIKDINNWNEIDQIAKDIKLDVYTTRSSDEYRDATRYDQVVKREAGQRHVNH